MAKDRQTVLGDADKAISALLQVLDDDSPVERALGEELADTLATIATLL